MATGAGPEGEGSGLEGGLTGGSGILNHDIRIEARSLEKKKFEELTKGE
jgi:hypothetical protein